MLGSSSLPSRSPGTGTIRSWTSRVFVHPDDAFCVVTHEPRRSALRRRPRPPGRGSWRSTRRHSSSCWLAETADSRAVRVHRGRGRDAHGGGRLRGEPPAGVRPLPVRPTRARARCGPPPTIGRGRPMRCARMPDVRRSSWMTGVLPEQARAIRDDLAELGIEFDARGLALEPVLRSPLRRDPADPDGHRGPVGLGFPRMAGAGSPVRSTAAAVEEGWLQHVAARREPRPARGLGIPGDVGPERGRSHPGVHRGARASPRPSAGPSSTSTS